MCLFFPPLTQHGQQQVKGATVDTFIAEAQDRTRNALNNSMLAAFAAFSEQFKADQIGFEAEQILHLG